MLITNRHVALPWENDECAGALADRGLKPEMIKFIFYKPGFPEAGAVELFRGSESADLAALRIKNQAGLRISLTLAAEPRRPATK